MSRRPRAGAAPSHRGEASGRRPFDGTSEQADPDPERAVAPGTGGPGAAAVVLAWVVGALAPIVRLATHGTSGVTAAVVLGVLTAGLLAVLAAAPLRERWILTTSAAVVVLAEILTVELVGRAPALVASAGVVAAALALGVTGPDGRARTWSPTGLLLTALGSLGWAATGSTLWLLAWVGAVAFAARTHRSDAGPPTASLRGRTCLTFLTDRLDLVLVAVVTGALATPLFHRLASDATVVVRGVNDWDDHYERVTPLNWAPFKLTAPHPFFHVLTKWLEVITGSAIAMTAIMVIALAAMAVTLVLVARTDRFGWCPLERGWAYALPVVYLLGASPAVLMSTGDAWWNRSEGFDEAGRGAGFFPLHIWGSPTLTLSMAMYLALVPLVLRLLEDPQDRHRTVQVLVLTVAVTLTSPSGVLGLAPGLALLLLIRWLRNRSGASLAASARSAAWLIAPAAVVVAWQMWFLATSQSPLEETTWRFNPFWMVEHFEMDRPTFWALLLLPLAGVLVTGRRFLADPAIQWCALGFVVSLFPTFLLQETGWKATHGGLAMTTFVCASLVAAFTVRLLLSELQRAWDRRRSAPPTAAHCVAIVVLLLVVAAGLVDYLTATGVLDRA